MGEALNRKSRVYTELGLCLGVLILGCLLAFDGRLTGPEWAQLATGITAAYCVSRGIAKMNGGSE